jgi:hypothetical protein
MSDDALAVMFALAATAVVELWARRRQRRDADDVDHHPEDLYRRRRPGPVG